MAESRRSFVPAAGHDWLLPLYDPLQRMLGGDEARRELVAQAALPARARLLDIGCGTGSLVVLLGSEHPACEVVGLDPDPKALARGRRKAERAGVSVRFDEGFSDELPYEDGAFDRVFSSFMLHHLGSNERRVTLAEARRVLAPGGSLHVVDFGGGAARDDGFLARLIHSDDHLHESHGGRLEQSLLEAGFAEAEELAQRRTLFGRIAFHAARV